jgi:quercetin dioxygenase-like cupin family protein
MTATLISLQTRSIRWTEVIEYPQSGCKSQTLLKDESCKYILMCYAEGLDVYEDFFPRNATVNVIEGRGILTLEGEDLILEPDVFSFIPANIPHSIRATSNLAYLLTLSEYDIDSSIPLAHSHYI